MNDDILPFFSSSQVKYKQYIRAVYIPDSHTGIDYQFNGAIGIGKDTLSVSFCYHLSRKNSRPDKNKAKGQDQSGLFNLLHFCLLSILLYS